MGESRKFYPWKSKINMLEQKKEYVLEADVEYPKELHKNHNELSYLA